MLRTLTAVCAIYFAVGTGAASAGDSDGLFAIKGAGGSACSDYIKVARNSNDTQLGQYVGWANGYLTAVNQFSSDTYDVLPWQSGRLLYLLLADYCSKNPDSTFGQAVYALGETLQAQRIVQRSSMQDFKRNGEEFRLYEEVMRRIQQRLNAVLEGSLGITGKLDGPTIAALRRFQTSAGLEPSGTPTEPTLMALFYPTP